MAGRTIPDCGIFFHLFLEGVIANIGEHLRGITESHEGVAAFRRTALITEHMGHEAESVELERGAQWGELGSIAHISAFGIGGSVVEPGESGERVMRR